jgi:tetratricopeptide (TPR) repeat protein
MPADDPGDSGNPELDTAVEVFQPGDYPDALALVDRVISEYPSDVRAYELRALTLFAMQDYPQAAATIHAVLAVGPGWDCTTLCSLYPDRTVYLAQLRALEGYVRQHPKAADARFLLAYHYLTQGHHGSAASELKMVVSLVPDDQVAADLLRMITGKEPAAPSAAARSAAPAVPLDSADLVGRWRASRDDGSKFELDLAGDKTFIWKFSRDDESRSMSGTYSTEKNVLVLSSSSGSMVGVVTGGGDRFNFKPLGGAADDPGLTFAK